MAANVVPSVKYSQVPLPARPTMAMPPTTALVSASVTVVDPVALPLMNVLITIVFDPFRATVPDEGWPAVRTGQLLRWVTVSAAVSLAVLYAVAAPVAPVPVRSTFVPAAPLAVSQARDSQSVGVFGIDVVGRVTQLGGLRQEQHRAFTHRADRLVGRAVERVCPGSVAGNAHQRDAADDGTVSTSVTPVVPRRRRRTWK